VVADQKKFYKDTEPSLLSQHSSQTLLCILYKHLENGKHAA